MGNKSEPTRKELEQIEKALQKGKFFDEEFDDFDAMTNFGDEDDIYDLED